ncbi:DUF1851 domain-containing protein [Rhizobiales bacterium RZME27]|jgi:hypothetical protein|uniref:DUF1851 domain-containing protein n=1 Tax=Endobacterium cereale TaxID=2663029 RepID=A0A6A8A9U1_9HYPH|nr:GAD-like domain-containing protein [Endobacterium cereale]MEB2848009.1 GAD-like domain-containing protein [Endobacterium cereale]MQY46657.1 DUF1851 domain-containing protein [Endobacterium cereale]
MNMHEDFEYLLSKNGAFSDQRSVDDDTLASLQSAFPEEFLQFWREAGLGVWRQGRFQFCNPHDMAELSEKIFAGDPDFTPDRTFIYGYGATGRLFVWNADWNETFEIDLPRLEATGLINRNKKSEGMGVLVSSVLYLDNDFYDLLDPATEKFVLSKFLKTHGALKFGEVYGYFPALAMGGSGALDSLKKVSAIEHFHLLADLGPIRLSRVEDGGSEFVRELGRQ